MQITYHSKGGVTVATIRLDNGMDINIAIRNGQPQIHYPRAALSPANARLLAEGLLAAARIAEAAAKTTQGLPASSNATADADETLRLSKEDLDSIHEIQRRGHSETGENVSDPSLHVEDNSAS